MVPESAGTTTVVVLFCGAGGLLLLIHPEMPASTTSDANIIFMLNPLTSLKRGASMMLSAVHWIRPRPLPTVGDLLQLGKKLGFCRLITRCMRLCFTARLLVAGGAAQ